MQLDPAPELALRLSFFLLFAGALVHKLAKFTQFRAAVFNYVRGSPFGNSAIVLSLAVAVVLGEAAAATMCLAPVAGAPRAAVIAGMLLLYAAAMAMNLLRGNSLLDCGCTWGSARQPVGYGLVARNVVLGLGALMLMLPVGAREMYSVDWTTVLAATLIAALMYASVNRLFTSAAVISGRI